MSKARRYNKTLWKSNIYSFHHFTPNRPYFIILVKSSTLILILHQKDLKLLSKSFSSFAFTQKIFNNWSKSTSRSTWIVDKSTDFYNLIIFLYTVNYRQEPLKWSSLEPVRRLGLTHCLTLFGRWLTGHHQFWMTTWSSGKVGLYANGSGNIWGPTPTSLSPAAYRHIYYS